MECLNIFKQYKGLPREIYILFLVRIINSMGSFVFPFLTLFLSSKIGMTEDVVGKFLMVVSFAGIPGVIIAGKLVDKYNRKSIMVIFSFLSGGILIICGFLGESILIPYLLVAQVFFISFSFPASNAMITDLTTPDNRQLSFSFLYLGMNLGMALGYILAGHLFENYTSWLFWGDGLTMIVSTSLVLFFVKETKPTQEEMEEISESGRKEEKVEEGSVFRVLLKRPYLLLFTLIGSLTAFAYKQHAFLMPLHLKALFGLEGAKMFGNVMILNTFMVVFFTSFIINITKNYKPISNIAIATVTYIIGFGMLFFANTISMFFIATAVWTTGEIIDTVNAGVYISNHSPVSHRGRFNAILGLIRGAGRSLAPFLMGLYLVDHNYNEGWLLVGFVATIAFILLLVLRKLEGKRHTNIDKVEIQIDKIR